MASYDTLDLKQSDGTTYVPRSGIRLRYASNGTVRPRAQSSAMRLDPKLVHKAITLVQWQAFTAFHESNRGIPFTVTFSPSGAVLTCTFAEKPFDVVPMRLGDGTHFDLTVYMVQTT